MRTKNIFKRKDKIPTIEKYRENSLVCERLSYFYFFLFNI